MSTPGLTFSQSGIADRERLRALNDELAIELLPVMIFLGVLMVTGIVGNAIVCYVFCCRLRMSTQHFLYVMVAIFDLLACCISIPVGIVRLRFYMMFESADMCRLITFIQVYPTNVSGLLLLVIGVDRYLKICRPLAGQMSLRHTKIALLPLLVVAFILSVPLPLIYGIQTKNITDPRIQTSNITNPPLQVSLCYVDDSVTNATYPLIDKIVVFVAFVVVVAALMTLYLKIWKTVKRSSNPRQNMAVRTAAEGRCSPPTTLVPPSPRSSTMSTSYKTAVVAVSITVVFFLSFLPYVVLVSLNMEFDRSVRGARLVVYNVFLHFPYVNSVANPFIYGALNNSFRQQCAHLRQRLLRSCGTNNKNGENRIATTDSVVE